MIEKALERAIPWGLLISIGALVGAAFPRETRAVTKMAMRNSFKATEWLRAMSAEAMEKGQDVFVEARSEYDQLVREAQREAERGRFRVVRTSGSRRASANGTRRRRPPRTRASSASR